MNTYPYLNFEGKCEEAITFYKKAIGAEVVMLMRHGESPEAAPPGMLPPGSENKVMHAEIQIGQSKMMMTDGTCKGTASFNGITINITVDAESEADPLFNSLADGGKITMPLCKTFFAKRFGMLIDRFGLPWMVYVKA
jgi:PhnB protein